MTPVTWHPSAIIITLLLGVILGLVNPYLLADKQTCNATRARQDRTHYQSGRVVVQEEGLVTLAMSPQETWNCTLPYDAAHTQKPTPDGYLWVYTSREQTCGWESEDIGFRVSCNVGLICFNLIWGLLTFFSVICWETETSPNSLVPSPPSPTRQEVKHQLNARWQANLFWWVILVIGLIVGTILLVEEKSACNQSRAEHDVIHATRVQFLGYQQGSAVLTWSHRNCTLPPRTTSFPDNVSDWLWVYTARDGRCAWTSQDTSDRPGSLGTHSCNSHLIIFGILLGGTLIWVTFSTYSDWRLSRDAFYVDEQLEAAQRIWTYQQEHRTQKRQALFQRLKTEFEPATPLPSSDDGGDRHILLPLETTSSDPL